MLEMKKIICAITVWVGLVVPALGEDWTGKLIDATCNDQQQHEKTVSCDATNATTAFALDVMGKVFKLDAAGNAKAATAMKYRAGPTPVAGTPDSGGTPQPSPVAKPASPDVKPADLKVNEVKAKVTGTEAGGMILVETIGLQ